MNSIYKTGINRNQQLLLPPSLNDYLNEENAVRAIDAYVESIDTYTLGFRTKKNNTTDGQPAFHPKLLLKIYIYGYLNKIRSSRRLEAEVSRNVELMWLVQGLNPSYKTISNFRKDNPKALKEIFKEFVLLCKNTDLITGELIAIDGAFLRANASKNQLLMLKNIQADLNEIDTKIDSYLTTLDTNDKEDECNTGSILLPKTKEKLEARKQKLQEDLKLLQEMGKTQYNKTDPDASLMTKPAHNLMAYNAQIAVDSKSKFIVETKVSTNCNDSQELHSMALLAKEMIVIEELTVVADTGYDSAKEIKKCIDDNITPIVPKANTQKVQADKSKFTRDKFTYDNSTDS
jgi:transposase